MSGIEIAVPVVAAIFALVSAFRDGGTIVDKVKERRQRKGKLIPNERLQNVLRQGAEEIETTRHEGSEEFGTAFETDAQTASKLKDITLALQDVIIKQLAQAFEDDDMNDFAPAIRTIIQARMEAVNVLNDLYLKLQRGPIQQSPHEEQEPLFIGAHSRTTTQHTIDRAPTFGTVNTVNTGMTGSTLMPKSPEQHVARTEPVGQTKEQKRSGVKKFFGKRASVGSTHEQLQSPTLSDRSTPNYDTQPQRNDTMVQNVPRSPSRLIEPPSPVPTRNSVISSYMSVIADTPIVPISEASKYGGLCKSAYYAQEYKFKKAMEPSMRDYERMYHCRKCKYRLMADSSQRDKPHFDDRIQNSSSAIRFRCLFLWKSHVETKNSSERKYKCLICLLARGESSIYTTEDKLFEHLTKHNGQSVGSVMITGPVEISSTEITAASMQSFDLYFPLDMTTRRESKTSFILPDSVANGNNIHNNDSNINNPGYGLGMQYIVSELDGGQNVHPSIISDHTQRPLSSSWQMPETQGLYQDANARRYSNSRLPASFDVAWRRSEGTKYVEMDATNVR